MSAKKKRTRKPRIQTVKGDPKAVEAIAKAGEALSKVLAAAHPPQPETPPPEVPPPIRYPQTPLSPLRPEQFPTVEQLATIAAALVRDLPPSDSDADAFTAGAFRLWRSARNEINKQKREADDYWTSQDASAAAIHGIHASVTGRLEKLKALEWLNRDFVSWDEAASLLWANLNQKQQEARLAALVDETMAGQAGFSQWTIASFREFGFSGKGSFGFTTLIQRFDEQVSEEERKAASQKASERGKKSGEVRRAKAAKKARQDGAKDGKSARNVGTL